MKIHIELKPVNPTVPFNTARRSVGIYRRIHNKKGFYYNYLVTVSPHVNFIVYPNGKAHVLESTNKSGCDDQFERLDAKATISI